MLIKLENITKLNKQTHNTILKQLNWHIRSKEIIGLLGHTGCGKTTIINIIAGIDNDYSGVLTIRNKFANNINIYDRNIRILNTDTELFKYMNVYENIKLGFRIQNSNTYDIQNKIIHLSYQLHIYDILHAPITCLSYGQQQKVKFARLIIDAPEIVLLDEPFDGLDETNCEIIYSIIRQMHQTYNTTFIISSHDNYEILEIATRITIIQNGCIVVDNTKQHVLQNYNIYSCEYFNIGTIIYMQLINKDNKYLYFMLTRFNIIKYPLRQSLRNIKIGDYVKTCIDPRSPIVHNSNIKCELIQIIDFIFYYQNIFIIENIKIQINTTQMLNINNTYDIKLKFLFIEKVI